jgi:hypothetical protein
VEEIEEPQEEPLDDPMDELEKRIRAAEKILGNFTIRGTGIAGNLQDGFQYNP